MKNILKYVVLTLAVVWMALLTSRVVTLQTQMKDVVHTLNTIGNFTEATVQTTDAQTKCMKELADAVTEIAWQQQQLGETTMSALQSLATLSAEVDALQKRGETEYFLPIYTNTLIPLLEVEE